MSLKNQSGNIPVESIVDEIKTANKTKAMQENKRTFVKEKNEEQYALKQGQVYKIGECLPPEIQAVKTKDKVCIVGFAPSWKETPWDDQTFDIWGINELYLQMIQYYGTAKRFTLWWEIHDPFSPSRNIPAHHDFLKKCHTKVMMQDNYSWIPNSLRIPKESIIDFFNQNFIINKEGASFTDYSNQISVMTALAIMLGYKEIRIYGVDMAQETEYAWQRASCQYFIGYATGSNIKVLIPKSSELCKHPGFYGFDTDNQQRNLCKTRINTLKKGVENLNAQILAFDYERIKQKSLYQKQITEIENVIQRTDDELLKLGLLNEKNSVLIEFLSKMPNNLAEITSKRDILLGNINTENNKLLEHKTLLENQKAETLKRKKELDRNDYMYDQSYQANRKQLEISVAAHQGGISENKHLLANNIL